MPRILALRFVSRVSAALAALLLVAGAWAGYQMFHRFGIEPAEPRLFRRTPVHPDSVTLVFGGDFAPTDAAMDRIRQHGYSYPYWKTAQMFQDADLAFANLEAPVTASSSPTWIPKKYIYKVEPRATEAWQWLGLDIVSIANNHVLDYRQTGLLDTVKGLDDAGLAHVGGGADVTAARQAVVFEVGETRVGFLAYVENQIGFNLGEQLFAKPGRPGCAQLNREDLAEDVKRLRPRVDVVVVSVHWGKNYSDVTESQRAYAEYLAELGVDLVVGHHSHNEQRAAVRDRTVILYSLGNYAWGAPGHLELRIGLVARVRLTPREGTNPAHIADVALYPIVTQNRIVEFQPRRVSRSEADWLNPAIEAGRAEGARIDVEEDDEGPWMHVVNPGAKR